MTILGNLPRPIRRCAYGGAALTVAYAGIYAILVIVGSPDAGRMLRMYALTMAAGREAALFDALHQGMSLPRAIGFSVLDDIGTLLLTIVVVWTLYRGLRRVPVVQWFVLRLETQALRKRAWIRRWGLLGLGLFFFLPGLGSGVLAACLLGFLARIPVVRMLVALGAASIAVDAGWAIALVAPARAAAVGSWVDWLPFVVLGLALTTACLGTLRDIVGARPILMELPFEPSVAQQSRMGEWGLHANGGLLSVDAAHLARVLGMGRWSGDVVGASELLVLDGMRLDWCRGLLKGGVHGWSGIAREPAVVLIQKADTAPPPSLGQTTAWQEHATAAIAFRQA